MQPPSPLNPFSAAQKRRLQYIEFRLWFYGEVSRKAVLDQFGVATAAGTRDLALYGELAPNNVVYERKCHRYREGFRPLFEHRVDQVLAALTAGFGAAEPNNTPNASLPHAVPARLNQPDLTTLGTVTRAIVSRQALELTYHSMKSGPRSRVIVPHALVDSGLRWHVRAYDRELQSFRDLVLTRMENVRPHAASASAQRPLQAHEQPQADRQWQSVVALTLVPHPAHAHPASIERDFGMQGGRLEVQLRAAVVGYVLRQWQVDCSPDAHLGASGCRLWLPDRSPLAGVDSADLASGYRAAEVPGEVA